jgi:hypothetical protein
MNVVVALHESTEVVAVEGVCDVVVFHCMTASARPRIAKGGERAEASGVLEGLVAQAEGRGAGDGVEPQAVGPGRNAVEESPGLVGGLKAQ